MKRQWHLFRAKLAGVKPNQWKVDQIIGENRRI